MVSQPLVSVLMPLYNKAEFVAESIESVLNQTYSNIELIIVDDGSTDDSHSIALKYADNKRIFVFQQENKGSSSARNWAFELCKGDYIQYLDADDLLHLDKIAEQMNRIALDETILMTSRWQHFKSNVFEKHLNENPKLKYDFDDMTSFLLEITKHGFPIHAWLIPRKLIEKAGKWDEKIFIFEDRDFFMRLVLSAQSVKYCDTAFCYYRLSQKGKNLSTRRDRQVLEGVFRYLDNFEALCLNFETSNKYARQVLACLHKKLLILSINDKPIVLEVKKRSIRLGLAPDCGESKMIKFCEKTIGIRLTFLLIYLKIKYL